MASFEQYRAAYEKNWANLKIRSGRVTEVTRAVNKILAGKPRYLEVERQTSVPWWFTALCHGRESNYNFSTYLGNGQRLDRKTTIVPIGHGPFATFEDGARYALKYQGLTGMKDWSIARVSYRLEAFNGFGYHSHGVNSPYLYGGSTCYGPPEAKPGKYVKDHDFVAGVVDTQLGTLVILKKLMELDKSVKLGGSGAGAATGGGIATGTGATVAVAWYAGVPWEAIAAIAITGGLLALLVWHFMRRKDVERPAFEGVIVKELIQDNKQ